MPQPTAHIFVDPLRPCPPTRSWPHATFSHLLSDNLCHLKAFARTLHLADSWLQWSDNHTPHFDLTQHQRLHAILAGAHEITLEEAASLSAYWQAKALAALERLRTWGPAHPWSLANLAANATRRRRPRA
jgi:hypothetical protein